MISTNTQPIADCIQLQEEANVLILAAGFEDRSIGYIYKIGVKKYKYCILLHFEYGIDRNKNDYDRFQDTLIASNPSLKIHELTIKKGKPHDYYCHIYKKISSLPAIKGKIHIDISGMPTYAICGTLLAARSIAPTQGQVVIYTAATNYFPTKDEYKKLKSEQVDGVEFLPKSMALEMSEALILDQFSGHRSQDGHCCLAIFTGYDVFRTSGLIESFNPSKLILLFGKPGEKDLEWRLDLSKQLHNRFESVRKTAIETVSTLDPQQSLDALEEYYNYLYEDYDLTISSVCSKMQTVASFLFWERYKEVQLVFPLPIGYQLDRSPTGIGETYITILEPKSAVSRELGKQRDKSTS